MTSSFSASLATLLDKEDFDAALHFIEKMLQNGVSTAALLATQVILLMKQGRYTQALKHIHLHALSLPFEAAYCYYALNDLEAAEKTLVGHAERRCQLLLAQIFYRLEKWSAAEEIYERLDDGNNSELKTNRIAVQTALIASGQQSSMHAAKTADVQSTYELSFNQACLHSALGNTAVAREYLLAAERQCRHELSTAEYTTEEIDIELGPIINQLAYLSILVNEDKDGYAAKALPKLATLKGLNRAAKLSAMNNLLAISPNPMVIIDGQQREYPVTAACLLQLLSKSKAFSWDKERVMFNAAILHVKHGRFIGAKNLLVPLAEKLTKKDGYQTNVNYILIEQLIAFSDHMQSNTQKVSARTAKVTDAVGKLSLNDQQKESKLPSSGASFTSSQVRKRRRIAAGKLSRAAKKYASRNRTIDPERWLPRWQRTAANKTRFAIGTGNGGKKKMSSQSSGPQGSATDTAKYDRSGNSSKK